MDQTQFSQWRAQPETQEFFNYLWRLRLVAMEDWAHRAFLGDTPEESNRRNDHALGQVEALTKLTFVEHRDIEAAFLNTGGIGEFKYPARREDGAEGSQGVGAAG